MCQEEDRLVELLEVLTFWNIKGIQHIWAQVDWFMDLCIQTTFAVLDLCWKNTSETTIRAKVQYAGEVVVVGRLRSG